MSNEEHAIYRCRVSSNVTVIPAAAYLFPALFSAPPQNHISYLIMIVPVRCFSCGKVVGDKWRLYNEILRTGTSKGEALDQLGLRRYCCRNIILSHVDLVENLLEKVPKRPTEQRDA